MKTYKFGGYGVDIRIYGDPQSGVVWGEPNYASYVLVEPDDKHGKPLVEDDNGNQFHIVSVNGIGEIRWFVRRIDLYDQPWLLDAFNVTEVK